MCYRRATRRQKEFQPGRAGAQPEVFLGHQGFLGKSKLVWFCKPIAKPSTAESLTSFLEAGREHSKATWSLPPSSGSSMPNTCDTENKQVPCLKRPWSVPQAGSRTPLHPPPPAPGIVPFKWHKNMKLGEGCRRSHQELKQATDLLLRSGMGHRISSTQVSTLLKALHCSHFLQNEVSLWFWV